jgi:hypothetical protein
MGDADWGRYKLPFCDYPVASGSVPTSVFGTRLVPKNLQDNGTHPVKAAEMVVDGVGLV